MELRIALKVLTVFVFVILFLPPVNASLFSLCGTATSSITLTNNIPNNPSSNISASGVCFTVGADNIVIDGNGFSIYGNGTGIGIDNSGGYDNIIIKNFANINNFSIAIYAKDMENATIENNTVSSETAQPTIGIGLDHSKSVAIAGNTIATNSYAVAINASSSNITIQSNNLSASTTDENISAIAVRLSSNIHIESNNITVHGSGKPVFGIIAYFLSSDISIFSNTITTVNANATGIFLGLIYNSILSGNTIQTTGAFSHGVSAFTIVNTTIMSNTITTGNTSSYGIGLSGYNEVLSGVRLSDNIIATTGILSPAIAVSHMFDMSITGNTLATTNSESYGIGINNSGTITIDAGNSIATGGADSDGMLIISTENITIESNTITTSNDFSVGINADQAPGIRILGNLVTTQKAQGIWFESSFNATASENTVSTNGTAAALFVISNSPNATITMNTAEAFGPYSYGIEISNSPYLFITKNSILTYNKWSTAILLDQNSNKTIIKNNTLETAEDNSYGIDLTSTRNTEISENTITTKGDYSSALKTANEFFSSILNNVVVTYGVGSSGIYSLSAQAPTYINNTITTYGSVDGVSIYNPTSLTIKQATINSANRELSIVGARTTLRDVSVTINQTSFYLDSIHENISLFVSKTPPAVPAEKQLLSDIFEIGGTDTVGVFNVSFAKTANINMNSIRLYWYNSSVSTWNEVSGDVFENYVSVHPLPLTGSTLFAVLGSRYECNTTLTVSLTLGNDIASNGTCFTVGADNITIDGNGYSVIGNGTGVGINNPDGYDNVTIRNFAGINNFTIGINATTMENSTIVNNTIVAATVSNGNGVVLSSSVGLNVSLNIITTSGSSGYGIRATDVNTSSFDRNTITTSGSSGYGFRFITSNANTMSANTIAVATANAIRLDASLFNAVLSNTLSTTGVATSAVYLLSSNATTVSSNIIATTELGAIGVYTSETTNNSISSNVINTNGNGSMGIRVFSSTNSFILTNSISTAGSEADGSGANGIQLSLTSNSTVSSNTITTTGAPTSYGIFLFSAINNTLSNNTVTASGSPEVYSIYSSGNSVTHMVLTGNINITTTEFRNITIDVISSPPASPSGKTRIGDALNITNLTAGGFIDFNLSYTDSQISGLTEST
ncbi:MAG: right-handed parallel beta-helix repeat-containing protein, partial [Candidatus Aenigmarchaeota archaeon]|nr:right-handed parallel beta-helix repeat-containing protein [Candidatus Aenigmarchaeota archaeon]